MFSSVADKVVSHHTKPSWPFVSETELHSAWKKTGWNCSCLFECRHFNSCVQFCFQMSLQAREVWIWTSRSVDLVNFVCSRYRVYIAGFLLGLTLCCQVMQVVANSVAFSCDISHFTIHVGTLLSLLLFLKYKVGSSNSKFRGWLTIA